MPPAPLPPTAAHAGMLPYKCGAPGVAGGISCKPVDADARVAAAIALQTVNARGAYNDPQLGPYKIGAIRDYATQVRPGLITSHCGVSCPYHSAQCFRGIKEVSDPLASCDLFSAPPRSRPAAPPQCC